MNALVKVATGERFAILEGRTRDGQPMMAMVNLSLKRIDHLLMDTHLTVTIPLRDPTPQALTTNEEGAALNALEDELIETLGHDGVYIGHETGDGRRTIHFHVAAVGPAELRAKAWARRQSERRIEIALGRDPRWEVLRRWK